MYGIVKPSLQTPQDFDNYKDIQCSLCNHIAWRYSNLGRLLVNTDSIFLGLLLDAQMTEETMKGVRGCRLLRNNLEPDTCLDYVSAISVLLGEAKAVDAYYDERKHIHLLYRLNSNRVRKAEHILEEMGFDTSIFMKQLREQHRIEKKKDATFDEMCMPSAKLVSKVFRHTAVISNNHQNISPLAEIGSDIGSILYVLDSVADFESDIALDRFNPLRVCEPRLDHVTKLTEVPSELYELCLRKLSSIEENCKKLNLHRHHSQIIHTLTDTLTRKILQVFSAPSQASFDLSVMPMNILVPAGIVALRALISQDPVQEYEACCDLCSCDAFAEDVSDAIFEELIDRGLVGGGSALVGGAAGILGARFLRGRKVKQDIPEGQQLFNTVPTLNPEDIPEEQRLTGAIVNLSPDDIPEGPPLFNTVPTLNPEDIPEKDRLKGASVTLNPEDIVEPSQAVNIPRPPPTQSQLKPPFPVLETPPPELPQNGVQLANAGDWSLVESVIQYLRDWDYENDGPFWKILDGYMEGRGTPIQPENLPEELKIREDAEIQDVVLDAIEAGQNAQPDQEDIENINEQIGDQNMSPFGSGGGITQAIGGGINASFIDQVEDEIRAEAAAKGLQWLRAATAFAQGSARTGGGPSISRHQMPGVKSPLGPGKALEDAAKAIGSSPSATRSLEGVPAGLIDLRAPDVKKFIEWMKIQKKDSIGHQSYIKFMEDYDRIPNTSDPDDVEIFRDIYKGLKEAAEP